MSQPSTINLSNFNQAIDAIVTGDTASLTQLLTDNPDLIHQRSPADHHASLIHYVTANGVEDDKQRTPENIVEIAKLLFDAGANPHELFDVYGQTSALIALITSAHPAQAGKLYDLVTLFCQHGNPNGSNNDGLPLATAIDFHSVASIKALLGAGATVDNLVFSAVAGDLTQLRELMQSDLAPYTNGFGTVIEDQKSIMGYALCAGALMGHQHIVAYLLENGISIDMQVTVTQGTALHEAVLGNHPAIVNILLEHGANTTLQDKQGFTPLHHASWHGQLEIMDILLRDKKPPLEVKNNYGGTVLDTAVYGFTQSMYPPKNPLETLQKLLSAGADANQVSPFPTGNHPIDDLLKPYRF